MSSGPTFDVIVVAAGSGLRMGASTSHSSPLLESRHCAGRWSRSQPRLAFGELSWLPRRIVLLPTPPCRGFPLLLLPLCLVVRRALHRSPLASRHLSALRATQVRYYSFMTPHVLALMPR